MVTLLSTQTSGHGITLSYQKSLTSPSDNKDSRNGWSLHSAYLAILDLDRSGKVHQGDLVNGTSSYTECLDHDGIPLGR